MHRCKKSSTFAPYFMKSRVRIYILAMLLAVFAQVVNAGTELVSNDPNWIGGKKAVRTTEGNDFWLTFINNNMINPMDPANLNNPDFRFEMKVAVSAREAMDIIIDAGISRIPVHVGANQTQIVEIPRNNAEQIYLFESEVQKLQTYRGVHVYADNNSKDKVFSCFMYSRVGGTGISSRDASLIIPTKFLGKEYIVQTYPEDLKSTEFAIIATEDETSVHIVPTFDTYGDKTHKGQPIDLTMSKGEAFLVASKEHVSDEDFNVDLSGTTICADKPIAVFLGNQQTGIPNREAYSQDFMVEQALPIAEWGTDFYLTHMENTKLNYTIVTAAFDNTEVRVLTYDATSTDGFTTVKLNLDKGGTSVPLGIDDEVFTERYITSNKPITCYNYITSAAVNDICTIDPVTGKICYTYGDPASAMMPSWNHRVQSMNMVTEVLDPQGGSKIPQHFFAYVVAKWDDRNMFSLNGSPVSADLFHRFHTNNEMAYAHIPLPHAKDKNYNLIESSGEGFVGMVYGLTDAQGYYYTLGYKPPHPEDSLYVTNTSEVSMSRASYDMDSLDGHGWYQRQEKEWIEPRLDTAVVCDSSWVYWAVETPAERPVGIIDWLIYDVTGKQKPSPTNLIKQYTKDVHGETKHAWNYQFILPEEELENRHQFFEYEIQAILTRERLLCTDTKDYDTLKTTVRVTRIYNDTLRRVVCVGDTLKFFHDSLPNPEDLSQHSSEIHSTKFIGVKKGQGDRYLEPWHYQVEVGKYDTLSRHYLSQAGCDSTITLVLYVCDTFQFHDTIHLCHNKQLEYNGKTINGSSYKSTDTVDIKVPFYTSVCDCQLGTSAGKFRDKNGNIFNGCDSTYFLHLYVHPDYLLRDTVTLCLDNDGKATYDWSIQYGTKTKTITETTPGMVWNEAKKAYFGVFRDSMQTKTCPDCENGGCDSIHELHLIFPKSYYFHDADEWCKLHYDPDKKDTVHLYYQWHGVDHLGRDSIRRVLPNSGDFYDNFKTQYGCDSIYHIRLDYKASEELYEFTDTTICFDSTAVYEWLDHKGNVLKTFPLNKTGITYDYDDSRCDTVYAIKLTVIPKYFLVDTVMISQDSTYYWYVNKLTYGGTKATEHYDVLVDKDTLFVRVDDITTPINGVSCDSIHMLFLRVGNVYRDTVRHFACGEDNVYVWMEDRPDYFPEGVTKPFLRREITELPRPGHDSVYADPHETVLGFDSIYYLRLYRAPSYHLYDTVYECQRRAGDQDRYTWEKHSGLRPIYYSDGMEVPFISLRDAGEYDYIDSIQTDSFKCDSIWHLHLHIYKLYDEETTIHTCQSDEPFIWTGTTAPDSIMNEFNQRIPFIPENRVGEFHYTLKFHTIHDCDSTWHLTLHVDTVYKTPVEVTERAMCDNDTLHFYDRIIYGVNWPDKPEGVPGIAVPTGKRFFSFDSLYTDQTQQGCDSAVLHRITMYRTYQTKEDSTTCQTWNNLPEPYYTWTGHARVWDDQRKIYIDGDKIPTRVAGNKTYIYIDSLKTQDCPVCDASGICGCDSIHILSLRIDSSYYFHNPLKICDNDTISWQGRYYRGEKFAGTPAEKAKYNRVLKSDTTYLDTVAIGTRFTGCDSTYYMTLRVAPTYDTTVTVTVCDNEDLHIFEFRDTQGSYFRDSIAYEPHLERPESDTAYTYFPVRDSTRTHLLKTIEGCDSIVRFHLLIKPTYLFKHQSKGCSGHAVEWRGKEYKNTGSYYDRYKTADGCDSIFRLDLYVKPFITIPVYDHVCDNKTYYHRDTVGTSIFEEVIWWPGAIRPDTAYARFQGSDGCDSIVYEYHLTVCPTYRFDTVAGAWCSADTFYSAELNHAWESAIMEFDVDTFVLPFDTIFTDSLLTVMGCDSVYNLKAHVLPEYRHIEYDTICSNEEYVWHSILYGDSVVAGVNPGIHYFRDSFLTVNSCDSLYELQLCVKASYFHEDSLDLCADETLQWRNHYFEHMVPGQHFFYDSLKTDLGCDSIYHLYLTVIDTTYVINYDSICVGDTFFIGAHTYTEPGVYKDTALNEGGCHHFIYTHLAVIEPTIPTVWADNPMCASEYAFDIFYTYTNHYPIAYTLLFDSVAHSMGFEDMEDIAITEYTTPMVISVPIPYGEDKTQYPRPDNYSIRLILDNGICRHKESDCYDDSTFTMSYPKWITEQRHGDVIALLNDKYNGGYVWSDYQWYMGDSMLVGQTQPYLYIPTGLIAGEQYHVRLTREGETVDFPSCPITIQSNPIRDDFAPTMGYLSVTPTCVVPGNPVVNILSRKDGTYRVTTSSGQFVKEGVFRADVTPIQIPATEGLYLIQLWSYDTPEEPYRAIKVIVRQRCETCATSF